MRDKALIGARVVAIFEATKGILILVAGIGLLRLVHQDVQATAGKLIAHLHLNPARHHPEIFINALNTVSDVHLWALACLAFVYALFRIAEGYGLWFEKTWAEWLAALTGAIYIPFEVIHLIHSLTILNVSILVVNIAIVAFMVWLLWKRNGGNAVA